MGGIGMGFVKVVDSGGQTPPKSEFSPFLPSRQDGPDGPDAPEGAR